MSRKDRRDGERRPSERRDSQPDDEGQRRSNEPNPQESDSLTALKAILAKVAALLEPLRLTADESIRLVEQLYGSFLETDVKLAGEADDRRKSSVLAHINNTTVTRGGDNKIVVEYPVPAAPRPEAAPSEAPAAQAAPSAQAAPPAGDAVPGEAVPTAPAAAEATTAAAPEQTALYVQPRAPRPPARPRAAAPRAAAAEAAPAQATADEPGPESEGMAADLV